jgi:hypothetical protein
MKLPQRRGYVFIGDDYESWVNCDVYGKNQQWRICVTCFEEVSETTKNRSQSNKPSGQEPDAGPIEYDAELLTPTSRQCRICTTRLLESSYFKTGGLPPIASSW